MRRDANNNRRGPKVPMRCLPIAVFPPSIYPPAPLQLSAPTLLSLSVRRFPVLCSFSSDSLSSLAGDPSFKLTSAK